MRTLLAFGLSLCLSVALAAPGDLDPSFGTAGQARIDLGNGGSDGGIAIAKLPDDRFIVLGYRLNANGPVLSRYLANGALDTSFGTMGIASTAIPNWLAARAIALQSDGAIVVLSEALGNAGPATQLLVTRYTGNGVPDAAFAGTGTVTVEFGVAAAGYAVAVQPDQKILLAGPAFSVARLNANGSLDTTFNGTGIAVAMAIGGGSAAAMALQPDGKILLAGSASDYFSARPVVLRINADGSQDSAFGSTRVFGFSQYENASALAVDSTGRILVGGTTFAFPGAGAFGALQRLNPDGKADPTFGTNALNGSLPLNGEGDVKSLAFQPSGKILAAMRSFRVLRFFDNGAADPGFTSPGLGPAVISGPGSMATQLSGNVVFGGQVSDTGGTDHQFIRVDMGDTSPASFRFTSQLNAAPASVRTSNTVIITSIASPAAISIVSGEYSIGCNTSFTIVPGTIANNQTVCVRHVTSGSPSTTTTSTLTVGGQSATFSSTTTANLNDIDGDGVPNAVELTEGLNPNVKDNDVFAATAQGARLFAMQQYRDFLNREGDTGGIGSWTTFLTGGGTRAGVVEGFFSSAEFQGVISPVARLYFAFFLRIPDYGGLQFWIGYYRAGNPLSDIANAFAGSSEFVTRYGTLTNSQFVDLVYQNVLGRPADAGGKAFWLGQLNGGMARGAMMIGFSESAEYVAAIRSEVNVTMTYVGMLRRSPDDSGFAFWVGYLDGGQSQQALINGFLSASEYRTRFLP